MQAKLLSTIVAFSVIGGGYFLYLKINREETAYQREILVMRADINRLKREEVVLRKQLGAIGNRVEQQLGSSVPESEAISAAKPAKDISGRLLNRISILKDFLAGHPEMADPEMRLLKDEDWVASIKDMRLDTEGCKRKATAQLRMTAQARLGEVMAGAVRDFADANNGQMPTEVGQLVSYLTDPSYATLLQGFEKAGASAPDSCLFQKKAGANEWYGSTCYVSDGQFSVNGSGIGLEVEQGIIAYQRATGGMPTDASQIASYLGTNLSADSVKAVFEGLRPSPNAPPSLSGSGGMFSISGNAQ